jgi:protein phosphatase 1 regulatory subunit 37
MALSGGLKANFVMRCLDLNIPPGDEEMARFVHSINGICYLLQHYISFFRMCRDILNSCVRNTEDAEKISAAGITDGNTIGVSSRRAGVWGMIEDSELAKTIRRDFDKVRS